MLFQLFRSSKLSLTKLGFALRMVEEAIIRQYWALIIFYTPLIEKGMALC